MDFTDGHAYWWNFGRGDQRLFDNKHLCDSEYTLLNSLASRKIPGKPLFVSEWDMPWPGEFRAEATLLCAAAGALQGWGGFAIHTYRYHNAPTDKIGRDVVLGSSFYRGIFDTFNDPATFGLFYHATLLTRRGDVAPAREERVLAVESPARNMHDLEAMNLLAETHRTAICLPVEMRDGARACDTRIVRLDNGVVRSDTNELGRNVTKGYGWIDSPRTKALYGRASKAGALELSGLTITCDTDFAVIALSSLTDKPIIESDSLLLTTVGRADNTGARYNEDHTVQLDCGH
jgi:hypothetical protein